MYWVKNYDCGCYVDIENGSRLRIKIDVAHDAKERGRYVVDITFTGGDGYVLQRYDKEEDALRYLEDLVNKAMKRS